MLTVDLMDDVTFMFVLIQSILWLSVGEPKIGVEPNKRLTFENQCSKWQCSRITVHIIWTTKNKQNYESSIEMRQFEGKHWLWKCSSNVLARSIKFISNSFKQCRLLCDISAKMNVQRTNIWYILPRKSFA